MAVINVTITALKQLAAPSLSDIYYVTDSGQEGEWKCTSLTGNSPSEENIGTVLIGNSGAKFIRVYGGVANILWFKTGTDWTLPVQRAINAAAEVYFPEGQYLISGSITVTGNKKLYGPGTITKEKNANVFFNYLQVTGANTVLQIEDLSFDGNLDPAQSHWKKNNPNASGQQQVEVIKASTFIYTENIKKLVVTKATFTNIHGNGIHIDSAQQVNIQGCRFTNIEGSQAIAK